MHELSLVQAVIDAVLDSRDGAQVHVVRLEVGREACASQDALRFAFEVCIASTDLEGAELDIVETDGAALRLVELEVT